MPAVSAPSPMMATARRSSPRLAAATAMPSAALIEVLEWPTPKVSYSLSLRVGKGREAAVLLDGVQQFAPPGQHLVRIGLVTDVPDQPVIRRIEHVVQRDGQLDRAQARGEMAAPRADALDQELPQLRPPARRALRPAAGADPPAMWMDLEQGMRYRVGRSLARSLYCCGDLLATSCCHVAKSPLGCGPCGAAARHVVVGCGAAPILELLGTLRHTGPSGAIRVTFRDTARMDSGISDEGYQDRILPHVSRTFALTIPQLPAALRARGDQCLPAVPHRRYHRGRAGTVARRDARIPATDSRPWSPAGERRRALAPRGRAAPVGPDAAHRARSGRQHGARAQRHRIA